MFDRSFGPAFVLVVAALVFTLPETGMSMGPFSVTGTTWDLVGKTKVKLKGAPAVKEETTATVRFLSDTMLELEDVVGTLFAADYTGGQIDENGKGSKKVTVTLTPTQIADAEDEIAALASDLLADNGLPGITPDIEITKQKIKGKLAKGGELLKVSAKFKFLASALGQSRKGAMLLKGKGPQSTEEAE